MERAKVVGLTNYNKIKLDQQKPVDFTLEEALTLMVEINFSKIKYSIFREALN